MKIYEGVVESNNDPLKMGRLRVRVLGVHSHIKEKNNTAGIPTDELPWSHVCHPTTSSSVAGIGDWKPIIQGSWVYCLPMDEDLQRWVILGTISGIPQDGPNTNIGFMDPDGKYPDIIGEPDFNRLAANRDVDQTIIPIKIQEQIKEIKVASLTIDSIEADNFSSPGSSDIEFKEPKEPYSAEYPYNRVIETERNGYKNGHIFEMDDTPDKERIHIWHKTGTFLSVHWDGQMVRRVVEDNYDMKLGNDFEFIDGDRIINITGDDRQIIKGNTQREFYGDLRHYVGGNKIEYISGNYALWIGADNASSPNNPNYELQDKKETLQESSSLDYENEFYGAEKDQDKEYTLNESQIIHDIEKNELDSLEDSDSGNGSWQIKVESDVNEIVDSTFQTEVTGYAVLSSTTNGLPGDYTIIPHGKFSVKGWSTVQLMGGKLQTVDGIVTGKSICPFIMSPHLLSSFTCKATF